MKKTYGWKDTFRLKHKLDASKVHAELEALQRHKDYSPRTVWQYARDHKDSELHAGFTWDVRRAAEKYWERQAQYIIRHIVVVEIEDIAIVNPTRSEIYDQKTRQYVSVPDALATGEGRQRILAQALRELDYFRHKYSHLQELSMVLNAITATLNSLPKPRKPTSTRMTARGG